MQVTILSPPAGLTWSTFLDVVGEEGIRAHWCRHRDTRQRNTRRNKGNRTMDEDANRQHDNGTTPALTPERPQKGGAAMPKKKRECAADGAKVVDAKRMAATDPMWLERARTAGAGMFGSKSEEFWKVEIARFLDTLPMLGSAASFERGSCGDEIATAGLAAIAAVQPRDEVEGMLASQMAATHAMAMEMLRRTKRDELIHHLSTHANLAVRLMRMFVTQTEAFAKLRRGGEQTVRVEHVHVHPGGQALVGNVTHMVEGEGSSINGGQPYGTADTRALVLGEGAPMLSMDPARQPVQSQGYEQGSVPIARGREG
jgi:hypothetical protein